jgi:competence protein ComEC
MTVASKFRAFQLDSEGSLFSYFKQNRYTLIEARLPKGGLNVLQEDLRFHGKQTIDVLHITSWDADHCTFDDLVQILNHLRPQMIEVPDYIPDSDDARSCRRLIFKYDDIHQRYVNNVTVVNADYINQLPNAQARTTGDVIYRSMFNCSNKNDMSLVRLFRSEGFNVLSLGDCEAVEIADRLMQCSILCSEVDVLILPHHGANNGFTSDKLLEKLKPKIAVCSSNYDNQYDHPRPEIRALLCDKGIPLMTTKRGDVIVYQEVGTTQAVAINYIAGNKDNETPIRFSPKRIV